MKRIKILWVCIFILCLVTPLGLLASGEAWGEWGRDFFVKVFGFIPEGLVRYSNAWNAPLRDYSIPGLGGVLGYILSAVAGIGLVMVIVWLLGKTLSSGHRSSS